MTLSNRFFSWAPLALILLFLYLPTSISMPTVDRDEARFAQASKQMVESGDLININFQDVPRHKKPIGIYWLQVASVKLFGDKSEIWIYRFPSVLGAILSCLLTFSLGSTLFNRRTGFVAALLFGSSPMLWTQAIQARADAVLLLAVMAAQLALMHVFVNRERPNQQGWGYPLLFWVAHGFGILLKGPITLLASGLTVLTLVVVERRASWLRQLRPIRGTILMVLIALPWVIAIQKATQGDFLRKSLGQDFLPKIMSGMESHGAPPGTYILLSFVLFLPLLLACIPVSVSVWQQKKQKSVLFCLAWLVPFWLLMELVPTKLPHYVLPVFPALTLLFSHVIVDCWPVSLGRWQQKGVFTCVALFSLICFLLAFVTIGLPFYFSGSFNGFELLASMALIGGTVGLIILYRKGQERASFVSGVAGITGFLWIIFVAVLPAMSPLWVSQQMDDRLSELVQSGVVSEETQVVCVGYSEPSAVFELGTETRLLSAVDAAKALKLSGGVAFVSTKSKQSFLDHLGESPQELGEIQGAHYSKGKGITLTIYLIDQP